MYFYPKNYLAAADDGDGDDDDFLLQFCICVSRELGIQFLFITHSAAKLFLNCPYQLRNEIYYLACVYRQFASSTKAPPSTKLAQAATTGRQRPKLLLPHHYQPRRQQEQPVIPFQPIPCPANAAHASLHYSTSSVLIDIISFVRRADNVLYIYLILQWSVQHTSLSVYVYVCVCVQSQCV